MESQYLNSTVWCQLAPSPIEGVGVFAIRDIPKGTKITDYTYADLEEPIEPFRMKLEEFKLIAPEIQELILDRMMFGRNQKNLVFISPNHDQVLQTFMNHSEEPNVKELVALRDIKKGEEITLNQREVIGEPHELTKKHMHFLWDNK